MRRTFIFGLLATAIGVGVYAMSPLYGKLPWSLVSVAADGASCELSVERGKTLDPVATGDLAAFRNVERPIDLKEIGFKDFEGNPKTIADWKGKYVLFNLWATWCPPCREEMPYFEALQEQKGGNRFEVVPVSIDLGSADKPKAFYEQIGLKALPFFQDATMEAFQKLRKEGVALGMPTTLLIDLNGCALGVLNGPAHWASDDAIRLIDATLALGEFG